MNDGAAVVVVEIFGQQYPIRSDLDQAYVAQLAQYVDQKMHASAEQTPGDMVRIAVLTALNIADEYHRLKDDYDAAADRVDRLLERLATTLSEDD